MLSPATLEKIDSRLHLIASRFSGGDPMTADDIHSEIVETVWKSCDDSQSVTAILMKAKWTAINFVEKSNTYTKHVASESQIVTVTLDDGDDSAGDAFEFFASEEKSPEDILAEREQSLALKVAIARLPADQQKVIALLTMGKNKKEIADTLGVTKSAVTQKVATIARNLQVQF